MRRARAAVALLVLLALGAAAVTAAAATRSSKAPEKLTIWVGWQARELGVFKSVVAEYNKAHPNTQWNVVGNISDDKIVAAIRAGNAPDVASSFNSYDVGVYCGTGGWIDLTPLMKQSGQSFNQFPPATNYYGQYGGKHCALPLLADDYGLYYNKTLFKQAGITSPPKSIAELTADAKKLTKFNPDGSIKVLGFDPFVGFYENTPERWVTAWGGREQWANSSGQSILAKAPGWSAWLKWQKSLVDWIGYKKLVKFQAGLGDEFSSSNAFEVGKVAMNYDGEWRVAFIQAEHPTLNYGTAPMPVANPKRYGSGYINGTIIGIPKNGKHQSEAWDLVKYLTMNTHALAKLSNGLRNVPSTTASLTSKELTPDAHFATFLKIFGNPYSSTSPITAAGVSYTNAVATFATKWQAGKVSNLSAGLSSLDKQLDAMVKQAGGGGVP
jgi:multiple sugar transport system substrate-binding protein